jgi:hypothetical protein
VELLRMSRNAWGQEVVLGMSWDLIGAFVAAGFTVIVLHALYRWLLARSDHA